MRFYNYEILAIFKDLPGIQNNRYNPFIRLKSFVNTFYVNISIQKALNSVLNESALFGSKRLAPSLVTVILFILLRYPAVTVFKNFVPRFCDFTRSPFPLKTLKKERRAFRNIGNKTI